MRTASTEPGPHGPNPYPPGTLNGQLWELNRALRQLGLAYIRSIEPLARALGRNLKRP